MRLLALLLVSNVAWAHSLSPMRFEVDSGTEVVVAAFMLTNRFSFQDRFAVDCYKGETGADRIPCDSIPESIVLSPNRTRRVKVRMPVSGDGMYRVCTIEDPAEDEPRTVITRMCALVGVGVEPVPSAGQRPKHRAAANAMAAGARQNPVK